ncbi:MAG: selenide, water dikinase SelD, partial [Deltaproteobacteria bacterium]
MSELLSRLDLPGSPDLLVGTGTADDAAVLRREGGKCLVATLDFITPPVDDPVWFGRIAAANALSDVYAMGGKPLLALNVVLFPSNLLPLRLLEGILSGAAEKVREAGAVMAGG